MPDTPARSKIGIAKDGLLLMPKLSSAARQVGGALLKHYNQADNGCYPGLNRLCEMTGLSNSGVRKAINELKEKGLFTVSRHKGRSHTNFYVPNFEAFISFVYEYEARFFGGSQVPQNQLTETDQVATEVTPDPLPKCQVPRHCSDTKHVQKPVQGTLKEIEPSDEQTNDEPIISVSTSKEQRKNKTKQTIQIPMLVGIPGGKTISSAIAARASAVDRLHKTFLAKGGKSYETFCMIAGDGNEVYDKAVLAELNKPGSGIRIMVEHIEDQCLARLANAG